MTELIDILIKAVDDLKYRVNYGNITRDQIDSELSNISSELEDLKKDSH